MEREERDPSDCTLTNSLVEADKVVKVRKLGVRSSRSIN